MNLSDLAHSKLLAAQRLHRFTTTTQFQKALDSASKEQQSEMRTAIESGDVERLRKLVHNILHSEIEEKPVAELRRLARNHRIRGYTQMTRATLLFELLQRITDVEHATEGFRELSHRDETLDPSVEDHASAVRSTC